MGKTIMIVEDNELNMKLLATFWAPTDTKRSKFVTVKTRSEAARTEHPDLIVMDMQLPGVSGLEVTRLLKKDDHLKNIPVLAVTAFAMKGDEDRIRDGGCEAYIAKPVRIEELLGTVRNLLGEI